MKRKQPDQPWQEIRLREDGTLDEVCISNANIHIEQMNDDCYWIGITRDDHTVHVNFWTRDQYVDEDGDEVGEPIHARVLDEGIGCAIVRQTATGYVPATLEEAKASGWEGIDPGSVMATGG